ncbi:MAG TPA: PhnD/SsuA/transferrin family substrate-binding protein, partial [Dissulfurispiraceae bacterium]|nr:PhnD/SsuA/transferrin family substrate-binding protein [Dissulfurispiraceae bacterium]
AGFVRESAPTVWREDVDLSKIRIVARTNYLPNWPVAACRQDRPELTRRVKDLLAGLTDEKILAAAKIKGFKPADEREFRSLTQY